MPLTDTETGTTEADITVEGVRLSFGQSLALRVAATDFFNQMSDSVIACGEDEHGRRMTQAYRTRLSEVLRLMVGNRTK